MKKIITGMFITLLVLSSGCGIFSSGEKSISPRENFSKKTYECKFTAQPVVLDGNLNDTAWNNAEKLWEFTRYPKLKWGSQQGLENFAESREEPAASRTEVMMLWDDKYLYLGAKLYDKDLYAMVKKHDGPCHKDDVLELFLRPSLQSHEYYEFQVNANDVTMDSFYPRRLCGGFKRGLDFESGIKSAVKLKGSLNKWKDKDEYWIVEMRIPFYCINYTGGDTPRPGDKWTFAVCRYNYSTYLPEDFSVGYELSSSADGFSMASFHGIEQYDYLEFVK